MKYTDLNAFYDGSSSPLVYDLEAIKQNLERLFKTGKGEVPFNRSYGTTLKNLIFENNVSPEDIKMFLYMDITDFEPRVELSPNDIQIIKQDANTYIVKCAFSVPSLNDTVSNVTATVTNE